MKKILLLTLLTALLMLAACGDGQGADVQESPGSSSQNGTDPSSTDTGTEPGTPGTGDDNGNGSDPDSNGDPQPLQVFSFSFRDVIIELDDDIDYIISKLGDPQDQQFVPSCAFEGYEDRIVFYPELEIHSYPSDESHRIFIIDFWGDGPRTLEGGIRLGSPVQSVLDAYGDSYTYEAGMYRFTRGLTNLEFIVENGIVDRIRYRLDLGL